MPVRLSGTAHRVFVGRAREFEQFEQAWSAVTSGARQVVLLGGEPGAGKSRLAAEVATALHERGAVVLLGHCIEEFGPSYQPFVQPLEALAPDILSGALPDSSKCWYRGRRCNRATGDTDGAAFQQAWRRGAPAQAL